MGSSSGFWCWHRPANCQALTVFSVNGIWRSVSPTLQGIWRFTVSWALPCPTSQGDWGPQEQVSSCLVQVRPKLTKTAWGSESKNCLWNKHRLASYTRPLTSHLWGKAVQVSASTKHQFCCQHFHCCYKIPEKATEEKEELFWLTVSEVSVHHGREGGGAERLTTEQ
jgi:hypothetical protein